MQEVIQRRLENTGPEVEALKTKLEAGETIIELSPDVIDPSFISDRMEITDAEVDELAEQIKDRGSSFRLWFVLILRRKDDTRLPSAIGASVSCKARPEYPRVVRKLTDAEFVVAQGQENNARLDLSFIEKARFAAELEKQGYSRSRHFRGRLRSQRITSRQ